MITASLKASRLLYQILIILIPSLSVAYDMSLMDVSSKSAVKQTVNCRGEFPERIYYGTAPNIQYLTTTSPLCFDQANGNYDRYQSEWVYSCDDNMYMWCGYGGDYRYCSHSGGIYPNEVKKDGYSCGYYYQDIPELCNSNKRFWTCQEAMPVYRERSGIVRTASSTSNVRDPVMWYLGEVEYWCTQNCTSNGLHVLFRLFAENYCNDEMELKHNYQASAGSVDYDMWFETTYHGVTTRYNGIVERTMYFYDYVSNSWQGSYVPISNLTDTFTREEVTEQYAGWQNFILSIPGTQCKPEYEYYFGRAEFWYDCAKTNYCLWYVYDEFGNKSCGQSGDTSNYFGFEFASDNCLRWTNYTDAYDGNLDLYRYPVNKQFQPTGPLEKVFDLDTNYVSWIKDPGGTFSEPESEYALEAGYKYRFENDMWGVPYAYEFIWWPCARATNSGQTIVNKGSGVTQRGKGVKSTGQGGFEKRTQ